MCACVRARACVCVCVCVCGVFHAECRCLSSISRPFVSYDNVPLATPPPGAGLGVDCSCVRSDTAPALSCFCAEKKALHVHKPACRTEPVPLNNGGRKRNNPTRSSFPSIPHNLAYFPILSPPLLPGDRLLRKFFLSSGEYAEMEPAPQRGYAPFSLSRGARAACRGSAGRGGSGAGLSSSICSDLHHLGPALSLREASGVLKTPFVFSFHGGLVHCEPIKGGAEWAEVGRARRSLLLFRRGREERWCGWRGCRVLVLVWLCTAPSGQSVGKSELAIH